MVMCDWCEGIIVLMLSVLGVYWEWNGIGMGVDSHMLSKFSIYTRKYIFCFFLNRVILLL